MGLCKCPNKKVSNMFCSEHKVSVCDGCLISDHGSCIVRSYLDWLQDSDYFTGCLLCNEELSTEGQECVRLLCLDVFHKRCLDMLFSELPLYTAPAGYRCPKCDGDLFPALNDEGSIARQLRTMLSNFPWARAGLGLPLIESFPRSETTEIETTEISCKRTDSSSASIYHASALSPSDNSLGVAKSRDQKEIQMSHKAPDYNQFDSDFAENKYKRRPFWNWFQQWLRSIGMVNTRRHYLRHSAVTSRRVIVLVILVILGVFTLCVVLSTVARKSRTDNDLMFDPLANPNVRINEE